MGKFQLKRADTILHAPPITTKFNRVNFESNNIFEKIRKIDNVPSLVTTKTRQILRSKNAKLDKQQWKYIK